MIDHALGHTPDAPASASESPTEVYLFLMGKETSVKSTRRPIVGTANNKRSPCGPKDRYGLIILPTIGLHRTHQASSTIWITQCVNETARCTSILKVLRRPLTTYLGLDCSHLGMSLQEPCQGVKPSRSDTHIAVQQYIYIRIHLTKSHIVTLGKPVIVIHHDGSHLGEVMRQHLERIILATIVRHYHIGTLRAFQDRRKESPKHPSTVPVEDDNTYLHNTVPLRAFPSASQSPNCTCTIWLSMP